jgi:tetratricopeptide (TPR) repeat protein
MTLITTQLILASLLSSSAPDLDPGKELRQAGKLEEAIVAFQEVLASQPDSLEAQRELGHSLALAGRYREAIEAYEKLAASEDLRWQLESAKWGGWTHIYLGDIDASFAKAEKEAQIAKQLGERSAEVHAIWYTGHVRTELGRFGQANAAFVAALELGPDDLGTLHQAGVLAAKQGDWGSLRYQIQDLEQAVARSGRSGQMRRVYHLQGELAIAQGNPKKAHELLEKANGLFPHPLYQDAIARAYLAEDNLPEAAATYRAIVESTDQRLDVPVYYVNTLFELAKTLDALEKSEEAASYYQKFLEHWGKAGGSLPGVTDAKKRLGELQAAP